MSAADDIDLVVEIERLAALDPIVYEATRTEAAKRLGMRRTFSTVRLQRNVASSASTPTTTMMTGKAVLST